MPVGFTDDDSPGLASTDRGGRRDRWLAFGPRPRVSAQVIRWALLWPVLWMIWTLVMGLTTGWFPYPFLDHREDGWAAVVLICLGVTALFIGLSVAAWRWDRRGETGRSRTNPRPTRQS